MLLTLRFYTDWQAGKFEAWYRAAGTQQVNEAHILERALNGNVDALPGATNTTNCLKITGVVTRTAFRNGNRALERVDNVRGADFARITGQSISTP
jgi:hypothetical protein